MYSSMIDVDKITNLIQWRCEDIGVQFRWDPHAQTAYTDGHTVSFPVPSQPMTPHTKDILYGYVIHECGHHIRSDAFSILNAARPPQHLMSLYNIVEDDGMERERASEWKGDKSGLSRMNTLLLKEASDNWEKQLEQAGDTQEPEPLASLMMGQLSSLVWDPDREPIVSRLRDSIPDNAKDLVNDLVSEGWVEKFQQTETPYDTWNVAVDLAKRLYPDNDQDEYEEIRQAGMSGETRDDSNSTMPDKREACKEEADSGTEVRDGTEAEDGGSDEADGGASDSEGRTISWKDCVLSDHADTNDNKGRGTLGITWEGKVGTGGVRLMPTNMINVFDPRSSKRKITKHGWDGWDQYMPKDAKSRQFANKVRRYLQAQTRTKVRRERETGRLDRGTLVRLGMPPIDGGEWNKKIFYDQTKRTNQDTAIFVLTDWSGSMMGSKMKYAADASQRLVHTMERVLKIPVALAAFTNRKTHCDIGYIKPFNTRGMTEERIAKSFLIFEDWSSGNNDADAVNWAYQQLLKRKESRKILIVISDGAPSGSFAGHPHESLKYVTNTIEKCHKVELYGVGVSDDAVKMYYTNHRVIYKPEDINATLFQLIKDGDNVK